MAMYLCICGEWVSSTENHTCKPYPSNVIMTDEDKEKNIEKIKTAMIKQTIDENKEALEKLADS